MKTKLLTLLILIVGIFETVAQCTGDVYIPNVTFKSYLLNATSINTVDDGQISCAEAIAYTGVIDVSSLGITNLTGIEAFTNITELHCDHNDLTSLDVSQNIALERLECDFNDLTSLDVSQNIVLEYLKCGSNSLISLDVSQNTLLEELRCNTNDLTSLNVNTNTLLTQLWCWNNNLTSLDVSKNTALTYLTCSGNNIIALDISNNLALETLRCFDNNLVSLKLTNGNSLNIITGTSSIASNFTNNPNLTCIEVDDANYANTNWATIKDDTASYSEDCDAACIVNIPDVNFKNTLLNDTTINTNGDTEISCIEAAVFTGIINVSSKSISDLTGIEVFVNATQLWCANNDLTSLNLSANTALTYLSSSHNDLINIDITKNTALTYLSCGNNDLTSLDVSKNIALETLVCISNDITSLDVTANVALTILDCFNNNLTSLNIANGNNTNMNSSRFISNPNLECIQVDDVDYANANWTSLKDDTASYCGATSYCIINIPDENFKNELVNDSAINTDNDSVISCAEATAYTGLIDVRYESISDLTGIEAFTNITELHCDNNDLTSLNVTANTNLTSLRFYNNTLTNIDVSKNTILTELWCYGNELTSLDVSKNIELTELRVNNNLGLTSIDVTANTNLILLACNNTGLTSIDVSTNTALTALYCYNNSALISLDISANTSLTDLWARNNDLLTSLNLANGNNTNMSVSSSVFNFGNNPNLTCIQVDDMAYANANWDAVKDDTATYSENCDSSLSVNELFAKTVSMYPNPTKNNITINTLEDLKQVEIITVLGKKVHTATTTIFNISHLLPGVYFVKITMQKGNVVVKEIIKN